jgi:hypothetical protein
LRYYVANTQSEISNWNFFSKAWKIKKATFSLEIL